jgi:hypothetical protein
MARLTIEQVRAPDFSSASEMLARANQSFTSGMESAKGILSSYNTGQQEKADQQILGALAGLSSEEELSSFLQNTDLSSMNISDTMRQNILSARAGILSNDATRQSTVNATDSNSRANAVEGRNAAEYTYGVDQRNQLASVTPALIAAEAEGRRYGSNGPTTGSSGVSSDNPVFSEFMGTVQQAGVTNPFALAAIAATGSHESGFSAANAARTWSDPSESGRPGTAGGVMSWNNDRLSAMQRFTGGDTSAAAQAAYFLQEDPALIQRLQNASSVEEAVSLMNNAWRFAGYDRPGGEAERRLRTAQGLVGMFGDGTTFQTSTQPVTQAGTGGGAQDALGTLLSGLTLPPDQAIALYRQGFTAQEAGNTAIAAAEQLRQAELSAEATRAAILNPGNLSQTDVQRDLLQTPGLSFGTMLDNAGQNLDPFAGVITPQVSADMEVDAALERQRQRDGATSGQDPLSRVFSQADEFGASENIGEDLISRMNIPEGSGLPADYVTRRITDFADAAGVTPAEMAANIAQLSDGNAQMFNDMLNATSDMPIYDSVISNAKNLFSEENRASFERSQRDSVNREANRAAAQLQYDTARAAAMKLPVGSPERARAEAEAQRLRDVMMNTQSQGEAAQQLRDYITAQGLGSKLSGTEVGTEEHAQAVQELAERIVQDQNLTDIEKELLLAQVQGGG